MIFDNRVIIPAHRRHHLFGIMPLRPVSPANNNAIFLASASPLRSRFIGNRHASSFDSSAYIKVADITRLRLVRDEKAHGDDGTGRRIDSDAGIANEKTPAHACSSSIISFHYRAMPPHIYLLDIDISTK